MRFTSVLVAGAFAAFASAQSKTASLSAAQQSQADCLEACDAGDVKCQSYCITVPSPDEKNINATTECVANCDQGEGSASDTEKYSVCLQNCISDNYWKTIDGTPRETSDSSSDDSDDSSSEADSKATATDSDSTASAAATTSDADSTDASETSSDSESESGTASGSAASATETGNGAPVIVGGVSLLGLFAAVLAL
ncbi:hypothetical protein FALBO_3336 [Fusarium albosuccineum]|uniref:HFB protein n=1 Tax=Fusarium albosuccineum TaxID=1237068 RepID=A0A8H4LHI8_9HYPO|nr:hypothetical protein FALBO_3336 [Fusarium albosuccineum]